MNIRLLLLPAAVILVSAGCRKDPYMQVYIDNMNAEKRLLEDTLYDLQYDYDSKVAEVEKLRQEVEALKSGEQSVLGPGGAKTRDQQDGPRNLFPDVPDLNIDPGTPRDAPPPTGDDQKTLDSDPDMDDLEPPQLDLGEEGPLSRAPVPLDQQVTSLYVSPGHTGGWQDDELPGDDGIVVALQPRNQKNDFVPVAGRVSVVLLDPESRQRVARWEFSQEEVAKALQTAPAGSGIELDMPWQQTPPEQSRLHLFVRYWLPEGEAVETDREITITPPGERTARWTPRTQQRAAPRRLNLADNPVEPSTSAFQRSADGRTGSETPDSRGWESSPGHRGRIARPARQAQLPRWRPFR